MTGIAAVLGRVEQLQGLVAPLPARPPLSQTKRAGDFATALAAAQGADPAGATAGAIGGTPATGAAGAAGGPTGADVVADARRYLGVPYVWGGTDPSVGLDCSGLVQRTYADLGIHLPRVSHDQAQAGRPVADLAQARPGDVLAFGQPVNHVAIYIGNHQMIAAPEPGQRVKVQSVYTTPTAIRRILPDPGGPAATAPLLRPAGLPGVTRTADNGLAGVPYADLFSKAAARYGLPPALLAAVAKVESGYDPKAVSPAGARGLMQLMPGTAAGLGVDPFDPAQAVDGAARLLSRDLADFGSLPEALAAYNAGPGAVRRYGGIPPFAETTAYVRKVQAAMTTLGSAGAA